MDMWIMGEVMWNGYGCALEHDEFRWMDDPTFSQIVISQSAATCAITNIAFSPIGHLHFDEAKLNQFFAIDTTSYPDRGIKFDTTNFAVHIPLFKEKVGPGKPLTMDIYLRDIKILFGEFDSDVQMEYKMHISFALDLPNSKELLYDEIKMVTNANVTSNNDILFISILEHRIHMDPKEKTRSLPIRNSMEMTTNEYREFLATFGFTNNYMKKYLNRQIFQDGIKFPYNMK